VPELAPQERLQPSLFDRLTDDAPDQRREGPEQRFLSMERLRESVRRDLGSLLNATHLAAVEDLGAYPEIERSTLNYGIPDLSGRPASSIDKVVLARHLRQAIVAFEPRLLKSSLKVQVSADLEEHSGNALRFDIEADLWCEPLPVRLRLQTKVDLEDGEVHVSEATAG
jgi:type VI secretion system protein ImpF